jgi:2,4-diketo-3-deoxy-L-fuconate hydrolase
LINSLSPAFGLGTFELAGEVVPAAVRGSRVTDLRPIFVADTTILSLLADWDASLDAIADFLDSDASSTSIDEVSPLPPIQPIGQILCAGANYYHHVEQIVYAWQKNAGDERPDEQIRAFAAEQARSRKSDPFLFPGISSAVSGASDDVVLWAPGEQHDWELELAVVIGSAAHRVSTDDALSCVAGYAICNDITVRDQMNRPGFPLTDFITSKNRPTYFPLGPVIVPRRFVADYRQLRIVLKVNGEVMQDELVADIINGVEECVSYASQMTTLAAGDVILTGSPSGNAAHHGNRWLKVGDVIESTITGLGTQRNVCVAPPA